MRETQRWRGRQGGGVREMKAAAVFRLGGEIRGWQQNGWIKRWERI
jgi:hypothetical protein